MEERLNALEKRVDALVESLTQMQKNQTTVTAKADASSNKIPQIDANTVGVADNSDGLFDIAEAVGEESDSLYELAEMVAELDARVTALEEEK